MDIEKISGQKLAKNLSEQLGIFFRGKKEALQVVLLYWWDLHVFLPPRNN